MKRARLSSAGKCERLACVPAAVSTQVCRENWSESGNFLCKSWLKHTFLIKQNLVSGLEHFTVSDHPLSYCLFF